MKSSQVRRGRWLIARVVMVATVAVGLVAARDGGRRVAEGGQAPPTEPAAHVPSGGVAASVQQTGQQIYQRCATCHQATGLGIPGAFPPLAGSEWATAANAALPIRIVLRGLQGPVTVKNQRFNSAMPAYGTGQPLSDADVASVLTYVRSSWGNQASAVTPAQVAGERSATAAHTTPWTAADLTPLLQGGSR
jgi:mono/diheme cytochrome c family protein